MNPLTPTPIATPLDLQALVDALRASRGFAHKRDISDVVTALSRALPGGLHDTVVGGLSDGSSGTPSGVLLGDDCAAIPDGDGHLLLAIEGLVEDFVEHMPWFAGYSGVMVNLSDIAAMGGRPIAVVDALWSASQQDAEPVLQGMAAASSAYGVPIVGGHSNNRAPKGQLAVAVLGRAKKLLSSFAARPGDVLLMAVDLRGQWQAPYPFWNASTTAPAERLRADLALLADIAEAGECLAAKDISMAGVLGTALMLLECSGVGATVDLSRLPCAPGHAPLDGLEPFLHWLNAFPSFGYVLSVAPDQVEAVRARFTQRGIDCEAIGEVQAHHQLRLVLGDLTQDQMGNAGACPKAVLWDLQADPFIGARTPEPAMPDATALAPTLQEAA
jgi:AIR synthase-related protein